MTLLAVDKIEVVYHRAVKAVQGITLSVDPGSIVQARAVGPPEPGAAG